MWTAPLACPQRSLWSKSGCTHDTTAWHRRYCSVPDICRLGETKCNRAFPLIICLEETCWQLKSFLVVSIVVLPCQVLHCQATPLLPWQSWPRLFRPCPGMLLAMDFQFCSASARCSGPALVRHIYLRCAPHMKAVLLPAFTSQCGPIQGRLRDCFLAAGHVHPVSSCSTIGSLGSSASELSVGAFRSKRQLCWL